MNLKFEFSEAEAQTILNVLVKAPFEVVAEIITKLQKQATEQIDAAKKDGLKKV